ncbi:sensor histidine kinase [Streptosporangium sp. G11]|uniref:sensor histidine kinase n=1 Tax=Streptosporangium sp. G11 TaxID=3436926 RepID=UPI003EBBA0B7
MNVLTSSRGRQVGMDLLLGVLAVASLWLSDDPLPEHAWTGMATLRVSGAVLLCVAAATWRRWPLLAAALPLVLGTVVAGDVYVSQLMSAVILFAFLLGRRTAGRSAGTQVAVLVAVAAIALVFAPGHETGGDWFSAASTLLLMVVVPWAVGQYLRLQADLATAGFELAARLEREHVRATRRERLRERTRIAADMHDSLGHELSLLAVRAGAVQVAAGTAPALRQAAAELRESAATATDRLRQIIRVLRQHDERALVDPLGGSVAALVERAAASGVDVRLEADDEAEAGLPDPAARAAIRVVQEGLTNATKHALGSGVRVSLRRTGDVLEVTVANGRVHGPRQRPADPAGSGYGLVGLDERVRLAGGTLRAGPDGDGFTLTARLPVDAQQAASPSPATPPELALAGARQTLRRGLLTTFWAPIVLGIVLLAVFLLRGGTL